MTRLAPQLPDGREAELDPGTHGRPDAQDAQDAGRRRRPAASAVAAAAGAVLLASGATAYALRSDDDGQAGRSSLPPATTEVVRATLTDSLTEGGTLGYGSADTVATRGTGTITWLPDIGDTVRRGRALYQLDADPVPLLYGRVPAWRDLSVGVEGRDVRQLEANLRALGYEGFDVDRHFTSYTTLAVQEWQEDLGIYPSGVVAMGDVVFREGPARVDSVLASPGDAVAPGAPVMSLTGTTPAATVVLDPSDRRLAGLGDEVEVTLPDGTQVPARITEVATQVAEGEEGPGGEGAASTTLQVVAELAGEQARREARAYDAAAVDVTFSAGERTDVLVVPVAALVALAEGGFGVEVVEGDTSRFVPVDAGLFSGGRVEIAGEGIREGTVVGVAE